jgi:phospholipid/cholesterol/gamma-HCH transport system substrate-binding protein
MKIRLNREQKIGLFAILILFSIYVVINYLKGKDLFSNRNTYYSVFYDIDGLTSTGPIFIRGLKVGTIESIDYIQKRNNFIVKLKIDAGYQFPKNSVAEIYNVGMLGTKALRINIGDGTTNLNNRDTMLSSTDPGMIDNLVNEILPLKDKLSDLIITLNTTFANVNDVLNPQAKKDIALSLENLNKTLSGAKNVVRNLEQSGPEITSLIENLNKITSDLGGTTSKLNSGLDNINEITDSLKNADIAGTILSLKELLEQIKNPEGSVGKLLYTDSVHSSIDQLIKDLDNLIKNITENPKKYIKVSVF